MKNDLVTVVTVTYNAEEFLEESILSVLNQTYSDIEYIIIDGGSTDKTLDIIKKYKDKISYWVSEPDEGIYFAMNKAIEKATGKWINFMNAGDTFIDNETITYIMQHNNHDSEIIYGNVKIGSRIRKPHNNEESYDDTTSICHQTLFAKTKLMKETPFDTKYKISSDHDFILKMYKKDKKFQYLDKEIANFLLNGLSDTQILRLQIEGLAVLFANNVSESNIKQSPWYLDMSKNISREKEKIIQVQELKSKQLSTLQNTIQKITKYSIWTQPLKKYNSYKSLLLSNQKIKDSSKGDKIENK